MKKEIIIEFNGKEIIYPVTNTYGTLSIDLTKLKKEKQLCITFDKKKFSFNSIKFLSERRYGAELYHVYELGNKCYLWFNFDDDYPMPSKICWDEYYNDDGHFISDCKGSYDNYEISRAYIFLKEIYGIDMKRLEPIPHPDSEFEPIINSETSFEDFRFNDFVYYRGTTTF